MAKGQTDYAFRPCSNANEELPSVTNDLEDYTVGEDLYGQFVDRPYTIIADYGDYAVVSEDKIFSLKGNGLYEVKDGRNRLLPKQEIDQERMQYAIELLTRYTK